MALNKKEGVIWFDGKWVPWQEAGVHVLTHSLHYGVGVFEGVRAYNTRKGTAIFRLQDHTDRLFRSAHILNIKIPYSKEVINQSQLEMLKKNNLTSAYIRPLVFYGSEQLGLKTYDLTVHVMIAGWEWGAFHGEENLLKGIKVRTSSFVRNSIKSMFSKAKASANYLNSVMALQEARDSGCDEALMLDQEGFVTEGSAENIFIVRDGIIYTPDTSSALEGITRDTIIKLAQDLGIKVVEKRITRDEVYIADEAFFTGTAAEVIPIREVDSRMIGNGKRGPVTEKLQNIFHKAVKGELDQYRKWLTSV